MHDAVALLQQHQQNLWKKNKFTEIRIITESCLKEHTTKERERESQTKQTNRKFLS